MRWRGISATCGDRLLDRYCPPPSRQSKQARVDPRITQTITIIENACISSLTPPPSREVIVRGGRHTKPTLVLNKCKIHKAPRGRGRIGLATTNLPHDPGGHSDGKGRESLQSTAAAGSPATSLPASSSSTMANAHAKGFTCWTQLTAMLFCQLAHADSLREICNGLACCLGKLVHLGIQRKPSKSNLSYANARRPAAIYRRAVLGDARAFPRRKTSWGTAAQVPFQEQAAVA